MSRNAFWLILFFLNPWAITGQRSEAGGGSIELKSNGTCLSDEHRSEIESKLKESVLSLKAQGIIPRAQSTSETVLFEFPLDWNEGFEDYGFYGIAKFVDHDLSFPGSIKDYHCGTRTYDTDAGNHKGTDYFLWPFEWNLVESNAVKVIAAAPGVIINKEDGHDHFNCDLPSEMWNAVYLLHADGSMSWYGHMKKNSLTEKNVGESVETGEFLGIVGSSGMSNIPHLHFEVHGIGGGLVDPYAGDCNVWNANSWWIEQRPYFDPSINKIQTHFAPPDFNHCPELAGINASDEFESGELVYFAAYFKDQRSTDSCQFSIIEPNDNVFDAWTFFSPYPYSSSSYWFWSNVLPLDAVEGVWTFKCEFAGKTYIHEFTVDNSVSSDKNEDRFRNRFNIYTHGNQIILQANSPIAFRGEIMISDVIGTRWHISEIELLPGENSKNIPFENIPGGAYFVTLNSGDGSVFITRKIVVNSE